MIRFFKKHHETFLLFFAIIVIPFYTFSSLFSHEDRTRENRNIRIKAAYNEILSEIDNDEEVITYTQNTFGLENSDKDMKIRALAENKGYKVTTNTQDIIGGTYTTIVLNRGNK